MAELIDDAVMAGLSTDGDPAAFIWQKFEYVIVGQPHVVFARTPWWEAEQLPELIDTELWSVDAARGGDDAHRYELTHGDGVWRLVADLG